MLFASCVIHSLSPPPPYWGSATNISFLSLPQPTGLPHYSVIVCRDSCRGNDVCRWALGAEKKKKPHHSRW